MSIAYSYSEESYEDEDVFLESPAGVEMLPIYSLYFVYCCLEEETSPASWPNGTITYHRICLYVRPVGHFFKVPRLRLWKLNDPSCWERVCFVLGTCMISQCVGPNSFLCENTGWESRWLAEDLSLAGALGLQLLCLMVFATIPPVSHVKVWGNRASSALHPAPWLAEGEQGAP